MPKIIGVVIIIIQILMTYITLMKFKGNMQYAKKSMQ